MQYITLNFQSLTKETKNDIVCGAKVNQTYKIVEHKMEKLMATTLRASLTREFDAAWRSKLGLRMITLTIPATILGIAGMNMIAEAVFTYSALFFTMMVVLMIIHMKWMDREQYSNYLGTWTKELEPVIAVGIPAVITLIKLATDMASVS